MSFENLLEATYKNEQVQADWDQLVRDAATENTFGPQKYKSALNICIGIFFMVQTEQTRVVVTCVNL